MATIKLQPSGAVVIKDGKVSCGCCEGGCCMYPASGLGDNYSSDNLPELSIDDNWELILPPAKSSIPGYEWDYYYYLSSGTDTYYVLHHDGKWYQGYTDGFRWTIYGPYNCLFEVAQGSLPIFDSSEEGFTPENQSFIDQFADTYIVSSPYFSSWISNVTVTRDSLCEWSGEAEGQFDDNYNPDDPYADPESPLTKKIQAGITMNGFTWTVWMRSDCAFLSITNSLVQGDVNFKHSNAPVGNYGDSYHSNALSVTE